MSEKFNRAYFDGIGYGTGKGDFYRDFPQHWKTAEEVLKHVPESVLEIGGARGYICKILQAHGVPATCMDISKHCWHTRAIEEFFLWDATNTPWKNIPSTKYSGIYTMSKKEYDLCFSIAFLEHVPEDKLPALITEMARVTRRGLHGITFTQSPSDHDETHATLKPKEWWQDIFKQVAPNYPVEIVDKEDLEKQPINLPKSDGLVKLNIGCFADMFYYGWKNVDNINLTDWAILRGYEFIHANVKDGIKVADNTVDLIIASHFLEHLNREEGAKFLMECYRVLKPDGVLRLAVPDSQLLASHYLAGTIMEFKHVNIGVDTAPDEAEAFYRLLLAGHQTIYDTKSLILALSGQLENRNNEKQEIKLTPMWDVKVCKPFESTSRAIQLQTISMYPTLSLYVEAKKQITCKSYGLNKERKGSEAKSENLSATHVEPTEKAPETPKTTADYKKQCPTCGLPPDLCVCREIEKEKQRTKLNNKLKIALLSTPLLLVPPKDYGGLELIVANLGMELAKLGHEVTIFAPNGSKVEGCHIVEVGEAKNTVFIDWLQAETDMYEKIKNQLKNFDIIHGHNWFGMEYRAKAQNTQLHVLHTHHGGLVADWWTKTRAPFKLNMCGISNWMKSVYEKQGIPTRAVYNGVDLNKYPLKKQKSNRFLWMSRIAFFKAPHLAIQVAKETGIQLDVAGATQFVEDAKYVDEIRKSCDGNQIRFIGEVTHERKVELLQNAKALLVTGKWGEPFGLHVIEALSCGTGVIAVADGGINETLKQGGILCQDIDALKDTVTGFCPINPNACRANAKIFSTKKMALAYECAYRDIIAGQEW